MSDKVLIERELLERIVNAPSLTDEGEAIDKLRARLATQPEASDVINGVPRKLLERLEHVTRNLAPHLKCHADLTALLTAQPQASAAQSAALVQMPDVDDLANFIRFTDGNHKMGAGALAERIVDWLSAPSAAQSAPESAEVLGERCIDGGKCHHQCDKRGDGKCFRRECCTHFGDYSGPWKYEDAAQSAPVIDLGANAWESIKQAASESKWIPPQYFMGDWVADVCEFLRSGRAAQSAPAGEREAFESAAIGFSLPLDESTHRGTFYEDDRTFWAHRGFQAGASWQRTQSAGVPDGWRVMLDRLADTVEQLNDCMRDMIDEDMEDPDMEREMCDETDELVQEARAMLAAPAQPAARDDDLLLELEDLRESLETARHNWRAFEDRCGDLQVENGKLRDRIAAAQDQGEVQRLREALERATKLLSAAAGYATKMEPMPAKLLNAIDAELDASTGQEVNDGH